MSLLSVWRLSGLIFPAFLHGRLSGRLFFLLEFGLALALLLILSFSCAESSGVDSGNNLLLSRPCVACFENLSCHRPTSNHGR